MKYNKAKYKVYTWKHPVYLFIVLNPLWVFPELLMGRTISKVSLLEREGSKPYYLRSKIPCPHCNTIHSALKWSDQNKTGNRNWYGYYCDNCGGIIPPMRSIFSMLFLAITFPIWGWFRKSLKRRWLDKQPERFANINTEKSDEVESRKSWAFRGLAFSIIMFVLMTLIFDPIINGEPITWRKILIAVPLWLIAGQGWGYWMKKWMNKKGKTPKVANE